MTTEANETTETSEMLEFLASENERLRATLDMIETITSTGDGLNDTKTIEINLLAHQALDEFQEKKLS